jgi:hypothetical protein
MSASVPALLTWLEQRPFAIAIAESTWMFPITETVHVLALSVVVGSVAMMDMRLLGLGNKDRAASEEIASSLPWTWCAFAVAFVAGSLLLNSSALKTIAIRSTQAARRRSHTSEDRKPLRQSKLGNTRARLI